MSYLFGIIIFLFGSAIGSFLNVVILRLPSGQVRRLATVEAPRLSSGQGLGGRSHCPKCGQVLSWYDLIPIVSFFILCGKCRYCGKKISWQYPLVEMATGLLFIVVYQFVGLSVGQFGDFGFGILNLFRISDFGFRIFTLCYMLYVTCSLIVIFVYDLRYYIIPDKVLLPAVVVSLGYRIYEVYFRHAELVSASQKILKQVQDDGLGAGGIWQPFFVFLLVAIAAAVFFLFLVLVTRGRGMGLGDVKLAFLMGLILGWPNILIALFLAFFLGALVGVGLIVAGKKTMKSQIPFGPFLVLGLFLALFLNLPILNYWL